MVSLALSSAACSHLGTFSTPGKIRLVGDIIRRVGSLRAFRIEKSAMLDDGCMTHVLLLPLKS